MKELSIEQKAKAYDEALERARMWRDKSGMPADRQGILDDIFPQLKESEDERIREEIISIVKSHRESCITEGNHRFEDCIAWLEKQKEYESTDFEYVWDRTDCGDLTSALDKYSEEAIINMCHAWYDKGIELERKSWLEKQGEEKTVNYPIEGMFPYTDPADTLDGEIENIWNKLRNCDNTFTAAKSGFYEVIHHFANWLEKQGEQKSIWHNEYEEPQRDSLILLIMQSGTPIVAKIIEPNHTFNHGEKWAYIDDLLEKQGDLKSDEWKEGDVVRHGGVLALVTNGRRAIKSNLEQITIQYPDEWVKAETKERKYFFDELEKQDKQQPAEWSEEDDSMIWENVKCIMDTEFCNVVTINIDYE